MLVFDDVPVTYETPVEFKGPVLASVISVDPDNSQMVVDGGNWDTANRSQVWSDVVTASAGNDIKLIFDGDTSTYTTTNVGAGPKFEDLLVLPAGVLESNEIEIYDINGDSGCQWSLDDATYTNALYFRSVFCLRYWIVYSN